MPHQLILKFKMPEMKLKKRFEDIVADENTIELLFPGIIVTDKPIYSREFHDCNGVVLLNHNFVGLSHYNLNSCRHDKIPRDYLPKLINEIKDKSGSQDIRAVLMAGDNQLLKMNKKILKDFKIPIIAEYTDNWEIDIKRKLVKKMIVIPSTQEVLMYSPPVNYKKLA